MLVRDVMRKPISVHAEETLEVATLRLKKEACRRRVPRPLAPRSNLVAVDEGPDDAHCLGVDPQS